MSPRHRGAQPGNRNAFKHGFYSTAFRARERRLLDNAPALDLHAEIELIRVMNERFLRALAGSASPDDVEQQLSAVRAADRSARSIVSLIRAQVLSGLSDDAEELQDILRDMASH